MEWVLLDKSLHLSLAVHFPLESKQIDLREVYVINYDLLLPLSHANPPPDVGSIDSLLCVNIFTDGRGMREAYITIVVYMWQKLLCYCQDCKQFQVMTMRLVMLMSIFTIFIIVSKSP